MKPYTQYIAQHYIYVPEQAFVNECVHLYSLKTEDSNDDTPC